ncbi:YjjG family noncanonical pyrimidine nucleotidase [Oscillospiraceae bacterium 21-37]
MEYRTLLLDADGTLLDFPRDMENAFLSLYKDFFASQRPYAPEYLACYDRCNAAWWAKLERGECTKPQLYVGRFVDFLRETGLTGTPERLTEEYFLRLGAGGAVYPGALELVERLAGKYSLYIVTNGNASTQKTRLQNSGLLSFIKDYFVSEDAGAAKPDSRYFDYVFSRLPEADRETSLVIGDSLTSDIQGAVNAGLHSLYYHPEGPAPLEGCPPYTYEAASYGEIAGILGV